MAITFLDDEKEQPKGGITFIDDAGQSGISMLDESRALTGGEINQFLGEDPSYAQRMSLKDYEELRRYKADNPATVDAIGQALTKVGQDLSDAAGAVAKNITSPGAIISALARGAVVGTGDLGDVIDRIITFDKAPDTYNLYRAKTNQRDNAETRQKYEELLAKDFATFKESQDYQSARKDVVQGSAIPELTEAATYVLDPTLLIPGAEAGKIGMIADKAIGAAVRTAGKTARLATRPVVDAVEGIAKAAAEAAGPAAKGAAAATGVTGAVMGVPGVREAIGAYAGLKTADKAAEVAEKVGESLMGQPSRIGPLEAMGRAPNASGIDRAIGAIGRRGGDAAIDVANAAAGGAITGAAIGGALGFAADGEEGLYGGIGSGLALGALGGALGRTVERVKGSALAEARAADLSRFQEALDQPTRELFKKIVDRDGPDQAVMVMDGAALLRSQFDDAKVTFLPDSDFKERFGASARGVQLETAGRPEIVINVDKPVAAHTFGHELFHAFDSVEQLKPQAEAIKQEIVGTFVTQPDGTLAQVKQGLLSPAEVDVAFKQYQRKLAQNGAAGREWFTAKTPIERAKLVGKELASEYMARMVVGGDVDGLLRGYDGVTRSLLDQTLMKQSEGSLRGIAERLGLGSAPVESMLFKNLKDASPTLNAMLRDVIRARRNLSERMVLAEDSGVVITPRDINKPVVADKALQMGVAERRPDGSVAMKPDDVLAREEAAQTQAIKNVIEATPVANPTQPHLRVVDGEVRGSGISPEQAAALVNSPGVSNKLKETLGSVSQSLAAQSVPDKPNGLWVEYGAATRRVKNRLTGNYTSKYSSGIRLTQREVVPYELYVSKAGNPVAKVVDISKLRTVAADLASAGRLGPYERDISGFLSDSVRYFDNISDPNGVRTRELPGMTEPKATFLNQYFGQQEKGGARFIRDLRLDRVTEMRPTGERIAASELAWQRQKVNWMPAEKLPEGEVISSNEGYRIISRKGKFSLYSPDGQRVGIYDTQAKAETVASANIKSANSTLGLMILEGKTSAEGLPPKPKVAQIAQWFQDRFGKAIDYTKATDAEKAKLVDSLVSEIQHAYKLHPEAAGWYDENTHLAMSVMRELDPTLAKSENDFIFKAILAVTSDGNLVEPQFQQTWKTYQHWKNTGNLIGDHVSGTRMKNIRGNIDAISAIVNKLGVDGAREWLTRKGTVGEVREAAVRDLGMTKDEAKSIANGELVDEVVPYAVVFGPKLGSFFNNLYGDFSTTTMDRWFMRTVGRLTGTQVENVPAGRIAESRSRIRDEVAKLTKDEAKSLGVSKNAAAGTGADDVAFKLGQYFQDKAARENLSPAANELRKAVNWHNKLLEPLVEAPQNGAHRKWIRERIDEVQAKLRASGIQLENADLQALLWYGEKELYEKLGYRTRSAAADYASAAAAIYAAEAGRPSRVYAEGSGRVGGIGRSKEPVVVGEAQRPKEEVGQKNFMPAAPDTPAFKRWFGDSKVVNEQGKPMVVYHGTTAKEFDTFRPSTASGWGTGIYFTDNKSQAASDFGYGGRVVEAFVSIKNPYRGESIPDEKLRQTKAWKRVENKFQDPHHAWEESGSFVGDALRELGYDGVITKNSNDIDGLEIVAFKPEQVKATTNQHPTDSPNMNFMPEAMPNGTVYRASNGYSVVNKAGAKYRVYSPSGLMIGVAQSLEDAESIIRRRK